MSRQSTGAALSRLGRFGEDWSDAKAMLFVFVSISFLFVFPSLLLGTPLLLALAIGFGAGLGALGLFSGFLLMTELGKRSRRATLSQLERFGEDWSDAKAMLFVFVLMSFCSAFPSLLFGTPPLLALAIGFGTGLGALGFFSVFRQMTKRGRRSRHHH